MQIFPNVYEIKSVFGNRWVQQYLFVGDMVLLLDAGVAVTPKETIFPYLEKIGISPKRIAMVIAMHADADHHGGLPAIKDASPGTLLACHGDDLKLIQDPEYLYQHRYNFLAGDHGLGFGREGMVNCPEGRKIDIVLAAGEVIQLAPDWRLRVWHVPGHSAGHLAVYDEKHHAAFTSDAVQANGYPTTDGKMAFGPTYYTVDSYLATVAFLENMPIEHMFSGHWPAVHGAEVTRFLAQSRSFVMVADELLQVYFKAHHGGVTLKQILADLSPKLGAWPRDMAPFLQFAMYGHLVRMEQRGTIRAGNTKPVEWSLA
jgi:glyoxylase-like metal-dependent hydrolase (beta-lactamase superfamily II)